LKQTSLVPQGLALYNGDVIVMDRSFPLLQCLQIAERSALAGVGAPVGTGVIRFVDDNIRRALNVRLMIPYSRKLMTSRKSSAPAGNIKVFEL
jgi:hypothetical protein